MSGARERILARLDAAARDEGRLAHPGPPPPSGTDGIPDPVAAFADAFRGNGGEVVLLADEAAARAWLATFAADFATTALTGDVPAPLRPDLPPAPAADAALGVSMAVGAAADSGTLLFSSAPGLRARLLPPVHLAWVEAGRVRASLAEAMDDARAAAGADGLPPTLALHSGPSKSADIGRIVVTGVHGPGRVVAAVIGTGAPGG